MNPFGATTRACLAWLTAAATLLAAAPRVQCRCPDGRVTTFSFDRMFPPACCAAMGDGAASPTSSASTRESRATCPRCVSPRVSGYESSLTTCSGGHCVKTTVSPSAATSEAKPPVVAPESESPDPYPGDVASNHFAPPTAPTAGSLALTAALLPTPDLVTLLQRRTC